jgi:hypothetical protein
MNWKKPFANMFHNKTLDDIKTGINFLAIIILLIFVSDISITIVEFYSGETTVTIPVEATTIAAGGAVEHRDAYGLFTTGNIGELEYKAKNVFQVLLYQDRLGLNTFSLLYMVIVVLVLQQSIVRVSDKEIFSRRLRNAFTSVGFLTIIYFSIIGQVFQYFQMTLLSKWTNNIYRYNTMFNPIFYIVFGILIGMAGFFIQKGEELQEDKSLTI